MCSCERHWNPEAPCTCQCDHKEDYVAVLSGPGDDYDQRAELPRLKQFVYVHSHPCSLKGKQFVYNPPTQGGVMLMSTPTCVEYGTALEHVETREV